MHQARRGQQKLVTPICKEELPSIPCLSLPPPNLTLANEPPLSPPISPEITEYTKRETILSWSNKWQRKGFEMLELEEDPADPTKILAQFRCLACRQAQDTTSPFYDGILSSAAKSLRQTLSDHFEGDPSVPGRERSPGCISQSKYLQNDLDFEDEDEETCSEEEWAPPPISEQRSIEVADHHEDLMFDEEHKQQDYPPRHMTSRSRNYSRNCRKRRHSSDGEEEKKRLKRKKPFKPEEKHFIKKTLFDALQREFTNQSFQFEVLHRKNDKGVDYVCGRVWCQACAQSKSRFGRHTQRVFDIPEGIITTANIRETLQNHCYPNPGQVKKLWVCLKHQEALRQWVVRQQQSATMNLPRANFISRSELQSLQTKYCKRGLRFDTLHKRNDMDGTPLVCILVRCEACIWLQGHCNDFGHEFGVVSCVNIAKQVKRHCKAKNVFHQRGWDHWRTIQKLKMAQHSEYTRMIRNHKRKQTARQQQPLFKPEPVIEQESLSVQSFSLRLSRKQTERIREGFLEDLQSEFPDLTIQVKDSRTLVMQAPKRTLNLAQRKLGEILS